MEIVDLHVHSNRSDGTLSPSQLVDYAMEKRLAAFALTDHDTVDGLEEALRYAESLRRSESYGDSGQAPAAVSRHVPDSGQTSAAVSRHVSDSGQGAAAAPESCGGCRRTVPEVIPGIELSTEYCGKDIHILGLYINHKNPLLHAQLKAFVDSRIERNQKMCLLLQGAGIPVTYQALLESFPDAVITRAHYAKYMLSHGYVRTMKEAFDRYVGDDRPCYVPREKVTPAQAVRLVLEAGGIPILAHPILYHMAEGQLDELTGQLKAAGLMGIEAVYSTYTAVEERSIRRLAARHDLLISGGSDFHGANKPGLDLATGYGKLFVPYSVLEHIKKAAGR